MSHAVLGDASFFGLLYRLDVDLAAQAQARGCPCGGVLHSARYPRKPRGGPEAGLAPDFARRHSYCCATEGCRRRKTPPSLRFLARRVYLAAVVVLVAALRDGPTAARVATLREVVGVSRRTLDRWRTWWRETFPASAFWRAARGRFVPPVAVAALPASLLARFTGADAAARLLAALRFLAPLTTAPAGAP